MDWSHIISIFIATLPAIILAITGFVALLFKINTNTTITKETGVAVNGRVDQLIKTSNDKHAELTAAMQANHNKAIAAMQGSHNEAITAMQISHNEAIGILQNQLAEALKQKGVNA